MAGTPRDRSGGGGEAERGGDPRLEIPDVLQERGQGDELRAASQTGLGGGMGQGVGGKQTDMSGLARAWGVAFDFVVTIVAGGLLGWGADYVLKSSPFGLLVGLGVGFGTGMVRIVRATQRVGGAGGSGETNGKPKRPWG